MRNESINESIRYVFVILSRADKLIKRLLWGKTPKLNHSQQEATRNRSHNQFTMSCIRFFFFATIAVACNLHIVSAVESVSRKQLDVMIGNSDEYAETSVTLNAPQNPAGFGVDDHAKITSVLETVKETIATARELMEYEETHKAGTEMMDAANTAYREVTGHIAQRKLQDGDNVQQTQEDEDRGMDVARKVLETVSCCTTWGWFTIPSFSLTNVFLFSITIHTRLSLFPSVSTCSLLIA
jgi:hypothetical protein